MKVSLIGPSNIKNLSQIIGKSQTQIENIAADLGRTLAKNNCRLVVIFGYVGMLQLVGNPFRENAPKSRCYTPKMITIGIPIST